MGAGWEFLVVDEGDPALARGLLIVWDGKPWLVGDGGVVTVSDGSVTTASCAVRLDASRSAVDPRDWAQHYGTVAGQWQAGTLVVSGGTWFTPWGNPGAVQVTIRDGRERGTVVGSPDWTPRLRPDIERSLMHDGLLLTLFRTRDPRGDEGWIAVATDTDVVRAALRPQYGDRLTVVQSRWTPALLDEITHLFSGAEVCSIGNGLTPDHQLTVAATVLRLPSTLAARLAPYPMDAISLTALVVPAGQSNIAQPPAATAPR
ncbi:hypothetical protein AB0M46_28065 [Dactylosporangium sp. NPDC051485]|uniref:hypothetical protein n=1 Tax=Dactylosporangium sp. NPDC051485 TaxID=3154846 RepID=UPI00342CDA8D